MDILWAHTGTIGCIVLSSHLFVMVIPLTLNYNVPAQIHLFK